MLRGYSLQTGIVAKTRSFSESDGKPEGDSGSEWEFHPEGDPFQQDGFTCWNSTDGSGNHYVVADMDGDGAPDTILGQGTDIGGGSGETGGITPPGEGGITNPGGGSGGDVNPGIRDVVKGELTPDEWNSLPKIKTGLLQIWIVADKAGNPLEIDFTFRNNDPVFSKFDPDRLFRLEGKLKNLLKLEVAERDRSIKNVKHFVVLGYRDLE